MINTLPKSLIEAVTNVINTHIDVDGEMKHRHNSEGKPIHHTDDGIKNFHRWFGDSKAVDDQGRPLVLYHGTHVDIHNFNTSGGTGKTSGSGSFFTTNKHVANTYTGKFGDQNTPNVLPVYVKSENPVVVEGEGKNWNRLHAKTKIHLPQQKVKDPDEHLMAELESREPDHNATITLKKKSTTLNKVFSGEFQYDDDFAATDDISRWAKNKGYNGVVFKSVRDQGPIGKHANEKSQTPSDIYVAFHPHHVKSAIGNNGDFSDKEAIHESTDPLKFHIDNPGGEWLQHKQESAKEWMRKHGDSDTSLGKGFSGSVTGYYNKPLNLPVSYISNLPGATGEEKYRGSPDNQKMKNLESDIGSPDKFDSKNHPIFVAVNHMGHAYVMEGNHRLEYARKNGIPNIHTEVRYFNGGETADKHMHPTKIINLHKEHTND